MTTVRTLGTEVGKIFTFRRDLVGTPYYTREPHPDLSAFEDCQFRVMKVDANGILGQVLAADGEEIILDELQVGLDEDLFKLNQ